MLNLVCELNDWPVNPSNNFITKNCFVFFYRIKLNRNTIKRKFIYTVYGIVFDGVESWNFCNEVTWNVQVFGVDNRASRRSENRKNNVFILDERPTDDVDDSIGEPSVLFLLDLKQNFGSIFFIMVMVAIFI